MLIRKQGKKLQKLYSKSYKLIMNEIFSFLLIFKELVYNIFSTFSPNFQ